MLSPNSCWLVQFFTLIVTSDISLCASTPSGTEKSKQSFPRCAWGQRNQNEIRVIVNLIWNEVHTSTVLALRLSVLTMFLQLKLGFSSAYVTNRFARPCSINSNIKFHSWKTPHQCWTHHYASFCNPRIRPKSLETIYPATFVSPINRFSIYIIGFCASLKRQKISRTI